jgi:MFS transporter, FHS family, L-fucose permease
MENTHQNTKKLLFTVYFIYFFCGLAQCFETVFIPEFKAFFNLDYQHTMYVNIGKNIALTFSILIGFLTRRIGFKNCLTIAMLLYASGTALIVPSLNTPAFGLVIAAFSIVGLGFSFQLVAGNPLLSSLGDSTGASSRLNFGNALGAVAWIVSPLLIAVLIPKSFTDVVDKIPYMNAMFKLIAVVLAATALLTIFIRNAAVSRTDKSDVPSGDALRRVWLNPKIILGFLAVFFVLGVESGIFSLIQNYLQDPEIIGLDARMAKVMFTVFFSVFALGRLTASYLQKKMRPTVNLAVNAVVAILLLITIISAKGTLAQVSMTLLGFFISIFFPTLYALTIEGMGEFPGQVSGLLIMGFLGCAVIPVLQGRLADMSAVGLQKSFAVGIVPYLFVIYYALKGHKLSVKT